MNQGRSTLKINDEEAVSVKKKVIWLLVFFIVVGLIGCTTENTQQPEQQVDPITETEKPVEEESTKEEAKVDSEDVVKQARFDEIKADLIERELIDEETPVYRFKERIVMEGIAVHSVYTDISFDYTGREYYVNIAYLTADKLLLSFNVIGTTNNYFVIWHNIDTSFEVLVGDEIIECWNTALPMTTEIDNIKSGRYDLHFINQRILDEVKENDHIVLFFTILGRTDVIILVGSDITL